MQPLSNDQAVGYLCYDYKIQSRLVFLGPRRRLGKLFHCSDEAKARAVGDSHSHVWANELCPV